MLDLRWHIPVQLRDHLISMVNEENVITEEAKNDMMKRFLSLKDVKLGGAQITSDSAEADVILDKLKGILQKATSDRESAQLQIQGAGELDENKQDKNTEKYRSVDVSHILKKIPLNESFTSDVSSKSFFLYNIDASVPEWKIADSVSQLLNIKKWSDGNSLSLIINHKAKCGGIRFQSNELGVQFAQKVRETITTPKGLRKRCPTY